MNPARFNLSLPETRSGVSPPSPFLWAPSWAPLTRDVGATDPTRTSPGNVSWGSGWSASAALGASAARWEAHTRDSVRLSAVAGQAGGSGMEVALMREAERSPGRRLVRVVRRYEVSGHLE